MENPIAHDPNTPLPWTGRYFDGFHNPLTMAAYANPTEDNYRAAGYGLVRFRKPTRNIVFECWPRFVDVTDSKAKQHEGWPVTVTQTDNYGRRALAYLPTLHISGQEAPVVQVVDEYNGEVVYTLRINGTTFRPKVFREGDYTLKVGEGKRMKIMHGIHSLKPDEIGDLKIAL